MGAFFTANLSPPTCGTFTKNECLQDINFEILPTDERVKRFVDHTQAPPLPRLASRKLVPSNTKR